MKLEGSLLFSKLVSRSNVSTAANTIATATRNSSAMKLLDSSNVIFKIEEAHPSLNLPGDFEPMPSIVNIQRVFANLSYTVKHKRSPRFEQWKKYYFSNENIAVISDFFWLAMCRIVHKGRYLEQEEILLDRIAGNYMQMFSSVPAEDKQLFFKSYYDILAQSVYYSMFFAFPKSRSLILSEEFKSDFFEIIENEVTGVPLAEPAYKKWVLNLGAGNILNVRMRAGSTGAISSRDSKPFQQVNLRYTPIMERYMKSRNYEGYSRVPSRTLNLSRKSSRSLAATEHRMESFVKFAKESVSKTIQRFTEYDEYSLKLREKMHKNRMRTISHTKLLNAYTDRILRSGAHEYANKIASLPKELQYNSKLTGR
jgi:hypothetical protein